MLWRLCLFTAFISLSILFAQETSEEQDNQTKTSEEQSVQTETSEEEPAQTKTEEEEMFEKAILRFNQKRYGDSIYHWKNLIKLNPENSVAWHNKGQALKELGRDEHSEQCFVKARESKPS